MRHVAAALIAILALACSASASGAPVPEPLEFSVTPVSGTHLIAQDQGGWQWTVTAPTGLDVEVRLRESPVLGTDGATLSDLPSPYEDFFGLYESTTNPGTYIGVSNGGRNPNWWTNTPGTYFWQIQASGIVERVFHTYVSPIFTVTVVAPPVAPPIADAVCATGTTEARIGGSPKCLRSGEFCTWRLRRQYSRYHFACVRKGKPYRLVRRG